MAAQGEVIQSFLVGLGFDVDESSLGAFNKAIQTAALRVTALYGAINAFAGGIVLGLSKISEGFEEMGYQYHIIAPAVNKMIVLRQEMMKAYSAAGINIRKVIVDSVNLNMSLAKTKFAMEAIYKSVGSRFFGLLTKQSDAFRKRLYDNMPYIINALEKLIKTVFKAFEAVTILGMRLWSILSRVYDFFVMLDTATNGWSTIILGVIAAWKLLNLSFLATPLGMLLAGFVALLALFDDFKTFKEGGKSLFDWSAIVPIVDAVAAAFGHLYEAAKDFFHLFSYGFGDKVAEQFKDLAKFASEISGAFQSVFQAITSASSALDVLIRKVSGNGILTSLLGARDNADQWVADKAGAVGNFFKGGQPLGTTPPHQTNTNANMQTQINITGSPNADATARATAQQQQTVNRDFARNLKGATR